MERIIWKATWVLAWILAQGPYFLVVAVILAGMAIILLRRKMERSEKE